MANGSVFLDCPKCGEKNLLKKIAVGYIQTCPKCGDANFYSNEKLNNVLSTALSSNSTEEHHEANKSGQLKTSIKPEGSKSHKTKTCPYCAEEIKADAIKCKHCGEWLDKIKPQAQPPTTPQQQKDDKSAELPINPNSVNIFKEPLFYVFELFGIALGQQIGQGTSAFGRVMFGILIGGGLGYIITLGINTTVSNTAVRILLKCIFGFVAFIVYLILHALLNR